MDYRNSFTHYHDRQSQWDVGSSQNGSTNGYGYDDQAYSSHQGSTTNAYGSQNEYIEPYIPSSVTGRPSRRDSGPTQHDTGSYGSYGGRSYIHQNPPNIGYGEDYSSRKRTGSEMESSTPASSTFQAYSHSHERSKRRKTISATSMSSSSSTSTANSASSGKSQPRLKDFSNLPLEQQIEKLHTACLAEANASKDYELKTKSEGVDKESIPYLKDVIGMFSHKEKELQYILKIRKLSGQKKEEEFEAAQKVLNDKILGLDLDILSLLTQKDSLNGQLASLNKDLETANHSKLEIERRLESEREELTRCCTEFNEKCASFDNQIEEKNKEIEKLKQQISVNESAFTNSLGIERDINSTLNAQIGELTVGMDTLEKEIKALLQKNEGLSSENLDLKSKLSEQETSWHTKLQRITNQWGESQKEVKTLLEERNDARKKLEKSTADLDSKTTELTTSKRELTKTKSLLTRAQGAIEKQKRDIADLGTRLSTSLSQLDEKDRTIQSLQDRIAQMTQEQSAYKQVVKDKFAELAAVIHPAN